jgi:hypothetical protein
VSLVEDDVLRGLTAEERATLYHLLQRAIGATAPSCEAADEPPAGQSRIPVSPASP